MTESFKYVEYQFPKCDRDSALIDAAGEGCLETVKKLLERIPLYDKCELINESPIRADDEDKWFSATALVAASKSGHAQVAGYLLAQGADPSLSCSPLPGVQETALSAALHALKQMDKAVQNILDGKHYIYDRDAWTDTEEVLARFEVKYGGLVKCISLLTEVGKYWKNSDYRGAKWSRERAIVHKVGGKPNKPRNEKDLLKEITSILTSDSDPVINLPSKDLYHEYNKLLLDKRCEMLELSLDKRLGSRRPRRQNIVGVIAAAGKRGQDYGEGEGPGKFSKHIRTSLMRTTKWRERNIGSA